MGIAAYNRGTATIRRDIAVADRLPEFEMMGMLNALPKHPAAWVPFGDIIFVSSHGGWFAECPTTGFGYWYPTLFEAVKKWDVSINGFDNGVWHSTPNK